MIHCYICYQKTDEDFLCDRCEQYYCEDCSYRFTIHYQHQGSRCYSCADQSRLKPLLESNIRDNKINLILNEK